MLKVTTFSVQGAHKLHCVPIFQLRAPHSENTSMFLITQVTNPRVLQEEGTWIQVHG